MGHPMEGHYDALRAERGRRWERRDAMEARLKDVPLSKFTAAQFPDLVLLYDRSAVSERWSDLEKALERLEAAFPPPKKKSATPRARRSS